MTESAALKIFSLNSRRGDAKLVDVSGLTMMPTVLRMPRFSRASMAADHASLAALLTLVQDSLGSVADHAEERPPQVMAASSA